MRRIALGEDALGTVAAAALSITVICDYGVDRASCDTGPTSLHLSSVQADPQKAWGRATRMIVWISGA